MYQEAFWKFVDENILASPSALRLKWHGKEMPGVDLAEAILQIECRQKFGKKLADTLARLTRFLFPSVLAGEQATSDLLASYHAKAVSPGMRALDLTAGLGIDAFHMAWKGASVDAVELDPKRASALRNNAAGIAKFNVHEADCKDYLREYHGENYDLAFIDPARRGANGERLFALSDCAPNVLELLPRLREVCKRLLIKASPMLDVTRTLSELPEAVSISAVGTSMECKELLVVVDFERAEEAAPIINAVTLWPSGYERAFAFYKSQEANAAQNVEYRVPKDDDCLLEPYPAVMKTAPFALLALEYGCQQPHPNTHIFTCERPIEGFPGSRYRIKEIIPYESKYLKRLHNQYPKIMVATRNFPISADALRLKLKVKDGGEFKLFAITVKGGKQIMIVAKPI